MFWALKCTEKLQIRNKFIFWVLFLWNAFRQLRAVQSIKKRVCNFYCIPLCASIRYNMWINKFIPYVSKLTLRFTLSHIERCKLFAEHIYHLFLRLDRYKIDYICASDTYIVQQETILIKYNMLHVHIPLKCAKLQRYACTKPKSFFYMILMKL